MDIPQTIPEVIKCLKDSSLLNEEQCTYMENLYFGIVERIDRVKERFKLKSAEKPKFDLPDVDVMRDRIQSYVKARRVAKDVFSNWKAMRLKNIDLLYSIGNSLQLDKSNCNIAKLTGNCVSALGGILSGIGIALAPVTFGATVPLCIAGGACIGLGTTTSVGTAITERVRVSSFLERAKETLEEEEPLYEKITSMFERREEMKKTFREILTQTDKSFLVDLWQSFQDAAATVSNVRYSVKLIFGKLLPLLKVHCPIGWVVEMAAVMVATAFLTRREELTFSIVTTASKAVLLGVQAAVGIADVGAKIPMLVGRGVVAKVAMPKLILQGALVSVSIVLDTIAIILTSVNIHYGSLSEEGKKVREVTDNLKAELAEIEKAYS